MSVTYKAEVMGIYRVRGHGTHYVAMSIPDVEGGSVTIDLSRWEGEVPKVGMFAAVNSDDLHQTRKGWRAVKARNWTADDETHRNETTGASSTQQEQQQQSA